MRHRPPDETLERAVESASAEASAERVAAFLSGLVDDLRRPDASRRLAERLREAAGLRAVSLVTAEPDGQALVVAAAAGEPFSSQTGRRLPLGPTPGGAGLAAALAHHLGLDPTELAAQVLCDSPFCLALVDPIGREAARFLARVGREVAVALEEARLAAHVAADRRRAGAVRELAKEIAQSLDPAHVWQAFLSRITAQLPDAVCALGDRLLVPGPPTFGLSVSASADDADLVRFELTTGCLAERALSSLRPAFAHDLSLSHEPGDRRLAGLGLTSAVAVPLVARATVAGVLIVGRRGAGPLSSDELLLVEEAAAHLAPAFANARAYRDLADVHARLEQTSRAKDTLSSLLIHDLRSPLTAALAGLEAVTALPELSETALVSLDESRESLNTVVELITALLEIARLQEGRMPCVRRPTALGLLVQTAVRQVALEAKRRGVAFAVHLSGTTFPLDGQLVARALRNLLVNAMRASPPGAEVEVRAQVEGHRLVVEVIDAGRALPADRREELFRKFSTAAAGGLEAHGLGLHFVRLAAEAHGGRALATETRDGRSCLVFELPDGT